MSIFDFNKPPEEDQNEPKPDVNKQQPSSEPEQLTNHSKPVSPTGDGSRWLASIFRRKQASSPTARNQPEATPAAQPETPTEKAKPEIIPTRGDRAVPQYTDKRINPGLRLRSLVTAGNNAPPPKPQKESRLLSRGERTRRAYWDVTAGFSLLVNAILVGVLLIMAVQINNLKTTVNALLSGFYGNFVEMDKASITTTITVDAQVPINFMLPIQQNTDVILTQDVAIPNAYVIINSGGLSISSQARVTLPAGTTLPIALNMAVPVLATVPITLQVPVNIPLNQTQLHTPFTGLQNAIRPFYCSFDKNAQYPQGVYICIDHDVPTPSPGVP